MKNSKKNSSYKARYSIFLLVLILGLAQISLISAWDWDNVKDYDNLKQEITIKNAFGLPFIGDDLAKYKLTENTDQCLTDDCYAEGYAYLYTDGYLFTGMNFANKLGQTRNLNYKIFIEVTEEYIEEIIDWEKTTVDICSIPKDKNDIPTCSYNYVYTNVTKTKTYWKEYEGEVLTSGTYKWRIEGKKRIDESIDWIASAFGEKFDEWAWWDTDWDYRICFNMTAPDSTRVEEPVYVNYSTLDENSPPDLNGASIDSFRVLNGSGENDVNVPFEVFDLNPYGNHSASTFGDTHTLSLTVNATSGQNEEYCLYYDNAGASNGETDFIYWLDLFTSNSTGNYTTYIADYIHNSTGYVRTFKTSGSNGMVVAGYDVNQTSNDYQVFATTRSTSSGSFYLGVGGWSLSRGTSRNANNMDGMVIDSYDATNKYRIIDYDASISVLGSGNKNIDINNNWVDEILYLEDLGGGNSNVTYLQNGTPVVGFNSGAFSPQLGRPLMGAGGSDYMEYDNFGVFAIWTHPRIDSNMIVLEMGSQESQGGGGDTTPPNVTDPAEPPNPSTYSASATYSFSVDVVDDTAVDTVLFEFGGTNYVTTNVSSNYSVTMSGLSAGEYNYTWIANDTSNNVNNSEGGTFTINRDSSSVYTYLDGSRGNTSVSNDSSIYLNGTLQAGVGNMKLFNNGTLINEGSSPLSNLTSFPTVGIYNITTIYEQTENYSASSETWFVNSTESDVTGPSITIVYPTNTTYPSTVTELNYTYPDADIDTCWYSTDAGGSNTTITCGDNVTGLSSNEGTNTWLVSANDTTNNLGMETVTFFINTTPTANYVYDDFEDGILNTSLWVNATAGSKPTMTMIEDGGYFRILLSGSGGSGAIGTINSTRFMSLSDMNVFVGNVTSRVYYSTSKASGSSYVTDAYFIMFGNISGRLTCSGVSVCSQSKTENYAMGYISDNVYDLYVDSVYKGTETLTDNVITGVANHPTSNTGNAEIRIYEVNYTLRKTINTNLTYPNNNTIFLTTPNFTANISTPNITGYSFDLQNATINIWYSNGSLVNQTTNIITGSNNGTIFENIDLENGDYLWNVRTCHDYGCEWGDNNNSLNIGLFIDAVNYSMTPVSGAVEDFYLNFTKAEDVTVSGVDLVYNLTNYASTLAVYGNNISASNSLTIPSVETATNVSFYWSIEYDDGTVINTTEYSQEIQVMSLDDCSLYSNEFITFNLLDEENQTAMGGDIEVYIEIINPVDYEEIITFNGSYSGVNNKTFCSDILLNESSFLMNVEVRYTAENYSAEFYNIQRSDLSLYPLTYSLYDLQDEDTTRFKIIYQGEDLIGVEGAIVQLQRKYISEGVYKIVEAPLTSSSSTAVVHVDTNTNLYQVTVVKDGVLLNTFYNLNFVCQSELTGECTLDLFDYITPPNSISVESIQDFYYIINESDDNNTITLDYSVPSGTTSTINVVAVQTDIIGEETICNTTVSSAGGSIECEYDETIDDSYLEYYVYKDNSNSPIIKKSYIVRDDLRDDFQGDNYFILIIFALSLTFMAVSSPEWIVINAIISIIVGGATWLVRGMDFVLGIGATVWLLLGAVIVIVKMSKQEDQ